MSAMLNARRTLAQAPSPAVALWALAAMFTLAPVAAHAFGFDDVAKLAKSVSDKAFVPVPATLPADLSAFDAEALAALRFRPEVALWHKDNLPFEVSFLHLGGSQRQAIAVNEIAGDVVRHVAFDATSFDYGKKSPGARWGDLGFAGFQIRYALEQPDRKDDLMVFLGSNSLRAIGRGQRYGVSARGLSVDTVGAKTEEVARFREFWIERPAVNATSLTLYALLDSPRVTAAYQFTVHPGEATVTDVRSRVFLRAPVATLALAPLSSMYEHGENDSRLDDFRPEVHGSDGLMMGAGDGEWLWRPLLSATGRLTTSFRMRDPKGFGLMQRDRTFTHYEDRDARFDRRPSAWIEPLGNWGPGRVELIQARSADESTDNVLSYWVPEQQPASGQPVDFSYRIYWQGDKQQRPPNGWTAQTLRSQGAQRLPKGEYQFVIDFAGPALDALPATASLDADVTVGSSGKLVDRSAVRNSAAGGWRVTMRVKRVSAAQPIELRAFLKQGNNALTETWTTLIPSN